MSRRASYTVDDIRAAVAGARSFAQVLTTLGLKPAGGNYKHLRQRLDAYFIADTPFRTSNHNLKARLIGESLLAPKCSHCGLEEWLGEAIPLELDHINGRNNDNRIENLRLLCPNCHALTPTYRGRNRGKH